MKTFTSYFVDSLFKHVLRSCDLCLVLTYKHEINNLFLDFISYSLENQESYLQSEAK
jgi:hypothetical protein